MTKDQIISMARETGLYSGNPRTPSTENMVIRRLERFAALIAAHEREECVKVHEKIELNNLEFTNKSIVYYIPNTVKGL